MPAGHLALIGATGIVGQEILRILEERDVPLSEVTLLASAHSEGSRLEFRNRRYVVRLLTRDAFTGVDVAIFAASAEASKEYAPHAVRAGAVVIDTSSAFRLDPTVPLCVPELNAAVLQQHRGIVAMPHGLTAQMALVVAPLHAVATLKRLVVATYQSVSGLGQRGVQEFDQQLRDLLNFRPPQTQVFPHQMAFNCLPQCGDFLDNGYTEEEMALVHETRRLLATPDLPITATAVRVPLAHGHAATVAVETVQPLSADEARALLGRAPGVAVEDDTKRLYYPLATRANGQDAVFVGRIRADLSVPYGLHLWIVADNLRQGAALNAVQIAEHLLSPTPPSPSRGES
jgi:aspartate-semialdehyde dehydrogenase